MSSTSNTPRHPTLLACKTREKNTRPGFSVRAARLVQLFAILSITPLGAQERGSIIEERAARKLLQAGDVRMDLGESNKAIEVWESVIDRYPRSPIRFQAHLRIADFFHRKNRNHDRARAHYEAASTVDNPDENARIHSHLMCGVCHYEAAQYGHCFKAMRGLIRAFPTRPETNDAHHYIGLSHFKQGHYGRAIDAFEKVGTTVDPDGPATKKVEAGRRLHIRIDDHDLAILPRNENVTVRATTTHGDEEIIHCALVGQDAKVALGSIPTKLTRPEKNNGILEVIGGDIITVEYMDHHSADRQQNVIRTHQVHVVGTAIARITDGGYNQPLQAAVLGKAVHVEITDADHHAGMPDSSLNATLEIIRNKTHDELDDELARRVAEGEDAEDEDGVPLRSTFDPDIVVHSKTITLTESAYPGVFRTSVPIGGDDGIPAEPGQRLRLRYHDIQNLGETPRECIVVTGIIIGNLGDMRVSRPNITDENLRLKTRLRTASALTKVGSQYDDFGLHDQAMTKYREALIECETLFGDARKHGGKILEETYVELWRIYFAMNELELALNMSRLLQTEFPNSTYVDEALLQQARVEQQRNDWIRAIQLYSNITSMRQSTFRGDAQFAIGECYEQMALNAKHGQSEGLFENAFMAYKKVYEEFPDSSKIGESVAKMAAFYYQKEDYERAIDVFENVLSDYPDAAFLDVILFNHGRCLFKLNRKSEARSRFEQILQDFPESAIATEAAKIVSALKKASY